MESIQLISVTPEQLKDIIVTGVKKELENFKSEFKSVEPEMQEEYLTRKEVATIYKVDTSTVYRWEKKNIIPAYGIGRKVRFKKSEVLNILEKLERTEY